MVRIIVSFWDGLFSGALAVCFKEDMICMVFGEGNIACRMWIIACPFSHRISYTILG